MDAAIPTALNGITLRYAALTAEPTAVPTIRSEAGDHVLRRVPCSTTIPEIADQTPPMLADAP